MPDLPTLTVTQEQADRMLAAFGTVANYRTWLRNNIVSYVQAKELNALRIQHEKDERDAQEAVVIALSP